MSDLKPDQVPAGSEIKHVWAIAWPLIVTNLLNSAVMMVDMIMVGRLGVDAIAAVGTSRTFMFLIMVLMIAVSGGASVIVAHAHGAGDAERVRKVAARSVIFMLLTSLLIVMPLGLLLARRVLVELGSGTVVTNLGTAYLRILFIGSIFAMFNFALTGVLIGVGRTKISLVLLMIINALNVIFNYVLIFGAGPIPAFGVGGAALGSILSRGVGSIICLWILRSARFPFRIRYRDCLGWDGALLKKILYLGGPRSLQGIVRNASRMMIIWIINRAYESPEALSAGARAVSAYTVAMQVRMTSIFVGLAFMSAAMSRVGQNLGAGDPERAERSGWIAARMATGLMSLISLLMILFPALIMRVFTDDPQVIRMGQVFFIIIALTEPVMALAFALGGALRGGGDPISPFIYSSVSDLGIIILAGYLLAITAGFGLTGIAIAMAISSLTRAIPTVLKFKQGRWKDIRV